MKRNVVIAWAATLLFIMAMGIAKGVGYTPLAGLANWHTCATVKMDISDEGLYLRYHADTVHLTIDTTR